MIKKLQSLKARKGFTIIELIVVIAIIGVLMAMIFPMLNNRDARVNEANSAARDFYAAVQTVMAKFSMYEGPLSPQFAANLDLGDMRYYEKLGGNYPFKKGTTAGDAPATTSLYIEFQTKNNEILDIYTCAVVAADTSYSDGIGLYNLCLRADTNKNTEFAQCLKSEIESRINYQDGYYYAKVTYKNIMTSTIPAKMEAETVKVEYAGYSRKPLPTPSGDFLAFKNANMYFGKNFELRNGQIFGVCAPVSSAGIVLGSEGTVLN